MFLLEFIKQVIFTRYISYVQNDERKTDKRQQTITITLIAVMGIKLDKLEATSVLLVNKVEGLESRLKISENVAEKLSVEQLDRLDQSISWKVEC